MSSNVVKDGIPREIERKYLIERPSAELLASLPEADSSEITQTYLLPDGSGSSRRVRKRGTDEGGYRYYYTEKTDVSFGERIEIEREITEAEHAALLLEADPRHRTIEKTRVCFVYDGQLFELDIYAFSDSFTTLEIELDDINTPVRLPDFLNVTADVTGDKRYTNFSLSVIK